MSKYMTGFLACSKTEDSILVSCSNGKPLDYHDGGWYRK